MKKRGQNLVRNLPQLCICSFWVLLTFVVLGYIVAASLSTSRDIFMGTVLKYETGFHWKNYATAWSKQKLYIYFFNSVIYAAVTVVGSVTFASMGAYILSRYRFPGNHLLKRILLICISLPSILLMLPLYGMILKYDISGRLALMIVYVCTHVPYSTIFLLNFFETISKTYEEAAAIDGCPNRKIFTKIMLPMVIPAVSTISLFNFLGTLNEYMICKLLIPKGNALSLGVGLQRTIEALKYVGDYPGVFAAILIVIAPTCIIYAFFSRKIVFGGFGGGIKG